MPVHKLFHSSDETDSCGLYLERATGKVCVTVCDNFLSPGETYSGSVLIDAADIPSLCRELRRFAKPAKQGGQDGKV